MLINILVVLPFQSITIPHKTMVNIYSPIKFNINITLFALGADD